MSITTKPRIDDIRRIALVTQRFMELQGLIPAALGAGLILSSLLAHAVGSAARSGGAFQAAMCASVLSGALTLHLQRMYRRTFGDVVATTDQKLLGVMPTSVVLIGALIDLSFYQFDTPRSGPSFVPLAAASYASWVLLRDWRWRIHHLVPLAAGLTGVIVTASVSPSSGQWGIDPGRAEAFLLAYTLTGLGLVIAGLCDHHVLASAMRRAVPEARAPGAARLESGHGLLRAGVAGPFCAAAVICVVGFPDRGLPLTLPLALMMAVLAALTLSTIRQVQVGIRDFNKRPISADPGPTLDLRTDSLVAILLLALAAAIDSALLAGVGPVVLTATIGLCSAWGVSRRWPHRPLYWLGTAVAVAVLFFIPRVEPARALAILILATAGAVTLEGLVDFVTRSIRTTNADTL